MLTVHGELAKKDNVVIRWVDHMLNAYAARKNALSILQGKNEFSEDKCVEQDIRLRRPVLISS